jgi:hypothetical protein
MPADVLRLKSANSDVYVEFSEVDGDDFRISMSAADHSATRRICAFTDRAGVARLLAEAARDWQGWKGAKVWESLDCDLRLELRTDRLGHVTLPCAYARTSADRAGSSRPSSSSKRDSSRRSRAMPNGCGAAATDPGRVVAGVGDARVCGGRLEDDIERSRSGLDRTRSREREDPSSAAAGGSAAVDRRLRSRCRGGAASLTTRRCSLPLGDPATTAPCERLSCVRSRSPHSFS